MLFSSLWTVYCRERLVLVAASSPAPILGNKQASKQALGSHVRLLANVEKSAWLALAWLVKIGVAAYLLEARLIDVYVYTEVLHNVEFVVPCTDAG